MQSQTVSVTLAALQQPVSDELEATFEELRRIVASDFHLIADVNEHLLALRGKLFRPMLLLLSAKASGEITDRETTLAAIVELIHIATLVHDDSVDHSVLRRGQPTVNAMFSHQVAVIMGDYLYSRAILELVRVSSPDSLEIMARVTNEMTVGEMMQLGAHDVLSFGEADYDSLIRAKTASLMAGACEVGALAGETRYRQHLLNFGMALGMAFQITDDVLDYTEMTSVTGKPSGLDLKEHKVTMPLIAALPEMDKREREVVEALMGTSVPTDDMVNEVVGIVSRCGGIDAARAKASRLGVGAEAELAHLPESPAKDALGHCLTYAIERRR